MRQQIIKMMDVMEIKPLLFSDNNKRNWPCKTCGHTLAQHGIASLVGYEIMVMCEICNGPCSVDTDNMITGYYKFLESAIDEATKE